jgi:hypothetical protein
MKMIQVLVLILAVGLLVPAFGWAQGAPPSASTPAAPSKERPMKRDLPPEAKALFEKQQAEMKAAREKHMEEMKALRQKHREERQALMQKLRQERGRSGPAPEKKAQ